MIQNLRDAVHSTPIFEKVADYELPSDISEWNEEIMKQFYEDVNYLPKEIGVDVVVNDVDENKGYAKGSVVAFYQGKKINFPIIVKDFKLSPFDMFIYNDGKKSLYMSANLDNVKKVLASEKIAELENYWGKGGPIPGVKSTGGVYPKQSVNIWEQSQDRMYPPFSKMSHWPFLAKKEDLEKLAMQMEAQPDVASSFVDNTGDLVSNIIELKDNEQKIIVDDHKEGDLDLKDVVKAKQAVTAMDSEFIDVEKMVPIKPPSVCEIRLYEYPSMEDFIESGDDIAERFQATIVGKAVSGIVIDYKEEIDIGCHKNDEPCATESTSEDKEKMIRNRRDQIFISLSGKYYSIFSDWNKKGIGFYGTKMLNTPGSVSKAVKMLSLNTSDDFINQNKDNRRDGSDKLFAAIGEMNQGLGEGNREYAVYDNWNAKMVVLYGAGDAWECVKFKGNFRKYKVNDSNVYVSSLGVALIPANVASIQKVQSVEDPIYKMVIGQVDDIFLFPESSKIINLEYMKQINQDDIMKPGKPIQKMYEDANIKKIAVAMKPIDDDNLGFEITGSAFEPLKKIAGLKGALTTKSALSALMIMGMEKQASKNALGVALNRYANPESDNKSVTIYGVRDDYINKAVFDGREKTAAFNGLIKEYAYSLRKDLIKEASVISDPEAVDVVLSLNFINEDSLAGYIDNIDEMKRIESDMLQMLIASRMGLTNLDESALKKAITGLSDVIKGLKELKVSTSDK